MSNFAFLQPEWPLFFEAATKAEGLANADARASCFYARRTLELAVAWMYAHDHSLHRPYKDNLSAFIHEPSFKAAVGDALFTKARLIKDLGNLAVHSTRKVHDTDAVNALRELFHFCYWLARTYVSHPGRSYWRLWNRSGREAYHSFMACIGVLLFNADCGSWWLYKVT